MEIYINTYVLTGVIGDLNIFYDAMTQYGIYQNPIGKELYDTQLDYLQKKTEGYDFKLDKKKKKEVKIQDKKPEN